MKNLLKNIRRILIIQLGDIGDVVWATPTFWAVKDAFPEAQLSILLREGFGRLLEADPSLSRIVEVRRYKGSLLKRILAQIRFIVHFRREGFDLAIDLRSDERGAYMAYASGAPIRVSLYYQDAPFLRNRLFTHLVSPPPQQEKVRGAAEQSLCLVRALGIKTVGTIPRLYVKENAHRKVEGLLQEKGIDENIKWLTLNPFSRWPYKEWGQEKWVEIVDWLWSQYQIATVIVGAEEEREKAERLTKQISGKAFNLSGETFLDELAALLKLSILHIGVDSAAPHIAAAVGTPTITIFGPSNWEDWAPVGATHRVILPNQDCVPCFKKGCDGQGWSRCLAELTVGAVKESIREALESLGGSTGSP